MISYDGFDPFDLLLVLAIVVAFLCLYPVFLFVIVGILQYIVLIGKEMVTFCGLA